MWPMASPGSSSDCSVRQPKSRRLPLKRRAMTSRGIWPTRSPRWTSTSCERSRRSAERPSRRRKSDAIALQALLTSDVHSLSAVRRWFARPLIQKIESSFKQWAEQEAERRAEDTITQGLQMLVDRVQRLMADQHIERIETVGQAFDGETMNAVDVVETAWLSQRHRRGTTRTGLPVSRAIDQVRTGPNREMNIATTESSIRLTTRERNDKH